MIKIRSTYRIYIPLAILLIFSTACRKDNIEVKRVYPDDDSKIVKVSSSVFGVVVDEDDNPIPNALIQSDNISTHTDRHGMFLLHNATLREHNAALTVSADDHFTAVQIIHPSQNTITSTYIRLRKKPQSTTFNARQGVLHTSSDGVLVRIPPFGVRNPNGSEPKLPCQLAAHSIPLDQNTTIHTYPSQPIHRDKQRDFLHPVSIVQITLEDTEGNALELNPNKDIQLQLPVPALWQGAVPDQLPLYVFDENTVRWVDQGVAQLSSDGSFYIATIHRTGYWGVFIPLNSALVYFRVIDNKGNPLTYLPWQIHYTVHNRQFTTTPKAANSRGDFITMVPLLPLKADILNNCNKPVKSYTFTPNTDFQDQPEIFIYTPTKRLTIRPHLLDCNMDTLHAGYAQQFTNTAVYLPLPITDSTPTAQLIPCDAQSKTYSVQLGSTFTSGVQQLTFTNLSTDQLEFALPVCANLPDIFIAFHIDNQWVLLSTDYKDYIDSLFLGNTLAYDFASNQPNYSGQFIVSKIYPSLLGEYTYTKNNEEFYFQIDREGLSHFYRPIEGSKLYILHVDSINRSFLGILPNLKCIIFDSDNDPIGETIINAVVKLPYR